MTAPPSPKQVADTEPDTETIIRELPDMLNRIARNLEGEGAVVVDDPADAAVLDELVLSARTLELHLDFLQAVGLILGDLPVFEAAYGQRPRPVGQYKANAGTFVYVAYDIHDKVIYVGVTDDLYGRMAAHRSSKRWWPHMERLEWEEWPDRQSALTKEALLIRRYRPAYNIAGNPDARKKR